jgi:hypothetical protein
MAASVFGQLSVVRCLFNEWLSVNKDISSRRRCTVWWYRFPPFLSICLRSACPLFSLLALSWSVLYQSLRYKSVVAGPVESLLSFNTSSQLASFQFIYSKRSSVILPWNCKYVLLPGRQLLAFLKPIAFRSEGESSKGSNGSARSSVEKLLNRRLYRLGSLGLLYLGQAKDVL